MERDVDKKYTTLRWVLAKEATGILTEHKLQCWVVVVMAINFRLLYENTCNKSVAYLVI